MVRRTDHALTFRTVFALGRFLRQHHPRECFVSARHVLLSRGLRDDERSGDEGHVRFTTPRSVLDFISASQLQLSSV